MDWIVDKVAKATNHKGKRLKRPDSSNYHYASNDRLHGVDFTPNQHSSYARNHSNPAMAAAQSVFPQSNPNGMYGSRPAGYSGKFREQTSSPSPTRNPADGHGGGPKRSSVSVPEPLIHNIQHVHDSQPAELPEFPQTSSNLDGPITSSMSLGGEEASTELTGEHILAKTLSQGRVNSRADPRHTLEAISSRIFEAAQDFDQLRGTRREDPEGAVAQILEAYKNLNISYNRNLSMLKKLETIEEDKLSAEQELKEVRSRLTANEKARSKLQSEKDDYQMKWNKAIKEKRKIEDNYESNAIKMKNRHAEEIEKLGTKISKSKREKDDLARWYESTLQNERDDHRRKVSQILSENEEKARQVDERAAAERQYIANMHTEAMDTLKNEFEDEKGILHGKIQSIKHTYEQRLLEEKTQHKADMRELNEEVDKAYRDLEKERIKMREESEDTENRLKKKFEIQMQDVRKDNEKLKGALVKREHIRGLTDPELGVRFKKMAGDVEDFSRLTWDDEKQSSWPFPEHILRQIYPDNPRKLKQQIVQNSIWLILFDKIFCTPFRILGKDGKLLDSEWMEEFGTGRFSSATAKWPLSTPESEKKRYETSKSCLEGLQPGRNTTEDSQKRINSYQESVAAITDEIMSAVAGVSTLEPHHRQTLSELIGYSGKLWLEVCSQRYRTVLVLPMEAEDTLTSVRRDGRYLKLVIKPEVRRTGNSQGLELSKEEVLSGWKGVNVEYRIEA